MPGEPPDTAATFPPQDKEWDMGLGKKAKNKAKIIKGQAKRMPAKPPATTA